MPDLVQTRVPELQLQPVPLMLTRLEAPGPSVSVTETAPAVFMVPWLVTVTLNVYRLPEDPVTALVTPGSG